MQEEKKKKKSTAILLAIVIAALLGCLIVALPILKQDAELSKDSEEYENLSQSLKMTTVEPLETDPATITDQTEGGNGGDETDPENMNEGVIDENEQESDSKIQIVDNEQDSADKKEEQESQPESVQSNQNADAKDENAIADEITESPTEKTVRPTEKSRNTFDSEEPVVPLSGIDENHQASEIQASPVPSPLPTLAPSMVPSPATTPRTTVAPRFTQPPTAKATEKQQKKATNKPKNTSAPVTPKVTDIPTKEPLQPSSTPSASPTSKPTATPTLKPTNIPTSTPTQKPTAKPTNTPTVKPTNTPTAKPTNTPTVKPTATTTVKPTSAPTSAPTQKPTASPGYVTGKTGADLAACKKTNSDFIAWLQIPNTGVDYPVVLTNDIDYYLEHTFTGKKSSLGTLFSLGKTDYRTPGKNIAIYGHDVEGSGYKMFKALLQYKNKSYYKGHETVYFDSIYRPGVYKIFAVFDITVGDWDPSVATFANDAEFKKFVDRAKALSLYDTGVNVTSKDTILTMITCDRYFKRGVGRLIVMAVRVK